MTRMGLSVLIFVMLGIKQNPLFWQKMCCKCFMCLIQLGRCGILSFLARRIVGAHNAVDEEEFNQFDEIPPFATCELLRLNANDKTSYLRTDYNKKIYLRSNSGRGRGRGRGRKET